LVDLETGFVSDFLLDLETGFVTDFLVEIEISDLTPLPWSRLGTGHHLHCPPQNGSTHNKADSVGKGCKYHLLFWFEWFQIPSLFNFCFCLICLNPVSSISLQKGLYQLLGLPDVNPLFF
jgi:hypothetical protein